LGETISHFATQNLLQLACKTKKTKHQFISLTLHLPTYLQAKKEKTTIEKQTEPSRLLFLLLETLLCGSLEEHR
jgi:hypothetical protein